MIPALVAFLLLVLWERPRLARWPAGERLAFWCAWGLVLAWSLAAARHVPLPTFPGWSSRLFQPLAVRLLTPQPDPYW